MAIKHTVILYLIFILSININGQEIYSDSIVYFDPNNKINSLSFNKEQNYKYILNPTNLENLMIESVFKDVKYTDLKVIYYPGLDAIKFTNGSLIVRFNANFDYSLYSENNNLFVEKIFKNLNIIIFKTNNIKDIPSILTNLKNTEGIDSARINFIDPSIIPN
tara:strand:- start:492 stop:980 length:489 start_codon:yes stop_codon:yes gene_type:complete